MSLYNYEVWPNFTKSELVCSHTGRENPNTLEFSELMDDIQALREWADVPFNVTSAYRDPTHPIEARKQYLGMHTLAAIDFQVPVEDCHRIVKKAFEMGFTGIGINLKGDSNKRFIHLDKRPRERARIWSY